MNLTAPVETDKDPSEPPAAPRKLRWHESLWPVYLAVLGALALNALLDPRLVFGDWWMTPFVGIVLLVPLISSAPKPSRFDWPWRRIVSVALVGVINLSNLVSLVLLVQSMLQFGTAHFGDKDVTGTQLVIEAIKIWLINIIVFALWYWELDRGGPSGRLRPKHLEPEPDFLFPQMSMQGDRHAEIWKATFVDYLFLSFTNSTAFSPTDTMPLTPSAKLLMMLQALASLLTIAFVAARAVNILR